jgi:hypothetical protein
MFEDHPIVVEYSLEHRPSEAVRACTFLFLSLPMFMRWLLIY